MKQEEYNLLDAGSAHYPGKQSGRANECLRHTDHQMACREHTREQHRRPSR